MGSIKEDKIQTNEKQQYKGSLCHRRQVTSTRETIAASDSVPGSNININQIVGNYECSSVVRSYFDNKVILKKQKLDLIHLVSNCIEDA